MWQRAVLIGLILFPATLADGQSTCDSDGTLNCNFTDTLCSLTVDSTQWSFDNCNGSRCAAFTGSVTGTMRSGAACSTGGHTHCLHIRYLFKYRNDIDLTVFVNNSADWKQVWNSTGQAVAVWYTADIPISSDRGFNVKLEAKKKHGSGGFFIDYMNYAKSPCQTSQTSTVPSSAITVSLPEKVTTTTSLHTSTMSPTDKTVVTTEQLKTTNSSTSSSAASTDKEKAGSSSVGVAVGVVVAVVIVAIAVFIFIIYRKKQLHLLKTCFRNGNNKKTGEADRSNGDDKRARNTGRATPNSSGYVNHAVTVSEPQSAHTYYNTTKDTEGLGEATVPQYSTVKKSQSSEGQKQRQTTKPAIQDPYEIKAEDGNVPWKASATRNANPKVNIPGKTGQYQNFPKPAANRDNAQSPSDYSMAQVVGDEATRVYHCLEEEDSYSKGEGEAAAVYHYAKDPGVNEAGNTDAGGVYHILEEESSGHQPASMYHVPKASKLGQQNTTPVKAHKEQTENYNTLDFAGKRSGQKESEDASGGVYNHLNDGSDDPYNEVHREKRAEVIDSEYSHIK